MSFCRASKKSVESMSISAVQCIAHDPQKLNVCFKKKLRCSWWQCIHYFFNGNAFDKTMISLDEKPGLIANSICHNWCNEINSECQFGKLERKLFMERFVPWSRSVQTHSGAHAQLYILLLWLHIERIEYTDLIWNPHLANEITGLESVQNFALSIHSR